MAGNLNSTVCLSVTIHYIYKKSANTGLDLHSSADFERKGIIGVRHVHQWEEVCFSGTEASLYKPGKYSEEETQLKGAVKYEGQWN